ncbi:MAG: hypothetical protein QMD65_00130 [Patescibacteria group bacterium]|nr:hypothetical protein [Patescibacteria group bacterium]
MNLNTKKKQKFVKIVVIIVAIGVVGAYVPLIFLPSNNIPQDANQVNNAFPQNEQTGGEQMVVTPVIPLENSTSAVTSTPTSLTVPVKLEPQGFKGLSEEGQSLDELNKLLNQ